MNNQPQPHWSAFVHPALKSAGDMPKLGGIFVTGPSARVIGLAQDTGAMDIRTAETIRLPAHAAVGVGIQAPRPMRMGTVTEVADQIRAFEAHVALTRLAEEVDARPPANPQVADQQW
jgi:hypothetical protein